MAEYSCETCGVKIHRFPSTIKAGGVFCSRKCAAQRQQKALPEIKCAQCGKLFYRKPSERKSGNNYCSRTCSNQAHSLSVQGNPALRTSKGREVICQNCGETFYVKPHRINKAKFCRKACAYAYRFGRALQKNGKDISGDKNPNFKGTNNRITARENATKYFGNACMICGWDISTDVHHITPVRHGGSNNLNNLIVLCPNHHRMADMALVSQEELKDITLAVIARLPDRLPQFDLRLSVQPEIVLQEPLFSESEPSIPSD